MKHKKLLAILTLVCFMFTLMPVAAFADETSATSTWDGTTVDTSWYNTTDTAFTIDTAAELAGLASIVNDGTDTFAGKTITLDANIDLANKSWAGIGIYDETGIGTAFQGIFDGNGKTISNVTFGSTNSNKYRGLFNQIYSATIKNLTVSGNGFGYTADQIGSMPSSMGGAMIVGNSISSTIQNCVAEGTFVSTHNVAGIVVRIMDTDIIGCTNKANLTGSYTKMGGIVNISQHRNWALDKGSLIQSCINEGNLTSTAKGNDGVGGIIGYVGYGDDENNSATAVTIENCENKGIISAVEDNTTAQCGQIVGMGASYMVVQGTNKGLKNTHSSGTPVSGLSLGVVQADETVIYTEKIKAGHTYLVTGRNGKAQDGNDVNVKPVVYLAPGQSITFDQTLTVINDFSGITPRENLIVGEDPNNELIVTYTAASAKIGETLYATVEQAITVAEENAIINLLGNCEEEFALNKSITLNLGTHTFTGKVTMKDVQLTVTADAENASTDTAIELVRDFEKVGYTFDGWYADEIKAENNTITQAGVYTTTWTLNKPTDVNVATDRDVIIVNSGSATLTASATHELDGVVQYQWYKDGTIIDGATGATHVVTGLAEAATYMCEVKAVNGTDASDVVASNAVTINVEPAVGQIVIADDTMTATYGDAPKTFVFTALTASDTITEGFSVSSSNTDVATAEIDAATKTVTVTIKNAGKANITVSYAGDYAFTAASDTIELTVNKAGAVVTPSTEPEEAENTVTYGESITLKAEVTTAQAATFALFANTDEVVFYTSEGTELGAATVEYTDANEDYGVATFTYDTKEKDLVVGDNEIIAVYGGSVNLNGSNSDTIVVTVLPKEISATLTADNKVYDDTKAIVVSDGTLDEVIDGDDVQIDFTNVTATVASADAGADKAVTVTGVALKGAHSAYYEVVEVAANNVEITKAEQEISYANESIGKLLGSKSFTNALTETKVVGDISYTSDDTDVATVNATTGEVTIIGAGEATITAIAAETVNYSEAEASYTLEVTTVISENADERIVVGFIGTYEGLEGTEFVEPMAIQEELSRVLTTGTGCTEENVETYDVKLQLRTDSGWVDATEDDFLAEGITVVLPYPEGATKATHDFVVTHMFTGTSTKLGTVAGQTERPVVTKLDSGIQVTLKGLSPVAIAWKEIASTTPSTGSSGGGFSGKYNYPVTVVEPTNGEADSDKDYAVEGATVTITTSAAAGYGVYEVIVTDEDGKVIPVTDHNDGTYSFVMPEGKVSVQVVCEPAITMVIDSVYINVFGKTIKNDVAPKIVDNRTVLPIRVVAENLGADVDWDPATQKVTITKGDTVIELFIGKTIAYVNGEPVQLDVAPFIENDRTYLPVRFVSEYLGAMVNWDAATRTVTIIPE